MAASSCPFATSLCSCISKEGWRVGVYSMYSPSFMGTLALIMDSLSLLLCTLKKLRNLKNEASNMACFRQRCFFNVGTGVLERLTLVFVIKIAFANSSLA